MSASNALENALLLLIFNGTTIANLASVIQGSPEGLIGLFVGLHTADPGEAGSQNTTEATYGQYQRMFVIRTVAGWTVTNNAAVNAAEILFNEAVSGSESLTHFSIGAAPTGAGTLYFSGALTTPVAVTAGIQPRFAAGQLSVTAD